MNDIVVVVVVVLVAWELTHPSKFNFVFRTRKATERVSSSAQGSKKNVFLLKIRIVNLGTSIACGAVNQW